MVAYITLVLTAALACGSFADVPKPLGVTSRTIGGGALNSYTAGVYGGVGLNNVALLVRMWGKVAFKDEANKFFYIDDGYGRQDGSGHLGVRVSYDNLATGESFTPPQYVGDYVAVTGISSTIMIGGRVQPNLRPRRSSDMIKY